MEGRLFTFLGTISHDHSFILVSHAILVMAIVLIFAKLAVSRLQVVPIGGQNVFEAFLDGVTSMGRDVLGEKNSRKYLPLIATIGLMVFFSNMLGIIPGFESPTGNINFTLALALMVFVYYNYEGIKENGFVNYFAHFMGPVKILAPLMFPIEIISHISRIISLSFRLFGSIKGDDMFLMVLLMLVPWLIPMVGFFALLAFGALQAFIFMMLTLVYLAGATMMEEGH
jgi:F-type H+-transporting ATPase subunit a